MNATKFVRRFVAILAVGFAAAPAFAQHSEKPDQPPAPPRAIIRTSPPFRYSVAAGSITQVNVDSQGKNIVGDAANEPSIAVDPKAPNRMVIGWRQFDNVNSNFRQSGFAWSNDGGRTWHFDGVIAPGVFGSDPSLDTDADGDFYYMVLRNNFDCFLFKSIDGGKTWGSGVFAIGDDKEWITIDKSGGIGDGNIYHVWTTESGDRSTNGGSSFGPVFNYKAGHWGTLAVGPEGEVYAASEIRVSRSDNAKDPGVNSPTFSVVAISLGGSLVYGGAPNPGGILGQAWVDVDRSNGQRRGWVYVLAPVGDAGGGTDVRFIRSTDGGKTWSAFVEVTGEPGNVKAYQWFGTMSVAPNGRIDAVWNDTIASNKSNISELRYASSSDGGVTWSQAVVLSPPWDSTIGWPQQQKIGDYYGMRSDLVGADLAWAATFTGGQDVYYTRIGDYDCNGNGVGDAEDISSGAAKDCNGNGIPDSCEIAAGAAADQNGNGVPDECETCYADCDKSGGLDIDDFLCFQTEYGLGNASADCDGSGELDIDDFICFQTAYAAGCP